MEVTHLQQFDTHAVMGGAKAQAFRMAETAEFFTVLSDTLYSNKKLAVVREVICNAWDAHIKAGKKNVSVKITLTADELIIEDQGPGIPEDAIVDIYCTYGKSTKVADDDQTGGFGLGSKAPFAYTSHFTVTNRHKGFRSVYAVSRGSTATGGKPDIRSMVRVPDDTTGVTVNIPVANDVDQSEFLQLIRTVVKNGDINATLNDNKLETYDLSLAEKLGFTIAVNANGSRGEFTNNVSVRYGSVIYPVDMSHQALKHIKPTASVLNSAFKLILLAPPNSIGVTPSRESLSYTDVTVETITKLIEASDAYLLTANSHSASVKHERTVGQRANGFREVFHYEGYVSLNGFHNTIAKTETDIGNLLFYSGKNRISQAKAIELRMKSALKRDSRFPRAKKGLLRKAIKSFKANPVSPRIFASTSHDIEKEMIARVLWKDNRKVARQAVPYKDIVVKHMFFGHDAYRYSNKTEFLRSPGFSGMMKRFPDKSCATAMVFESKAEASRWFTAWRYQTHVDWSASSRSIASSVDSYDFVEVIMRKLRTMCFFIAPKAKWKAIDELIKVLEIPNTDKPKIVKPSVQVETRLYDASQIKMNMDTKGLMRFKVKDGKRVDDKFSLMIPCRTPKEGEAVVYPESRLSDLEWIVQYFDDAGQKVGLVMTSKEKIVAGRNGIRLLADGVQVELSKILKSKKILETIAIGDFYVNYDEWENRNRAQAVTNWLNASDEFRRMIIPSIPKLNEEEEKLYMFWKKASVGGFNWETKSLFTEIVAAIMKKAKETGKKKTALKYDLFLKEFPGIETIDPNTSFSPRLMDILKMFRAYGRKMKKETDNG